MGMFQDKPGFALKPINPGMLPGIALRIGPRNVQALAWEIVGGDEPIVEKYGGLNNASADIGMMPDRKLGLVILTNRGNHYPNEVGRRILLEPGASSGRSRRWNVWPRDPDCFRLTAEHRPETGCGRKITFNRRCEARK